MAATSLSIAMLSVHSCPLGSLGSKDTGGMSVYVRELASELGRQGHSVDIFTRAHLSCKQDVMELAPGVRLVHLAAGEEGIPKLEVYPHLPQFARQIEDYRSRSQRNYQLIFSHYWLSGKVGQYLKDLWGVPHVTMFHTLGAVKNTLDIGENEPALRLETERGVAGGCDLIIAPTEREKTSIVYHYGAETGKIGVVPCGVNLELFRPRDKGQARRQLGLSDSEIILFVGRLEPLKGLARLLEAVACLRDFPHSRLLIVGGDEASQPESARWQHISRKLGIQDRVSFIGMVESARLPDYYNAADVCVVASYYESFGLVAMESLACGTPVVATDVGDLRSIITSDKAGYVVADGSPRRLADKITLVLAAREGKSAPAVRETVNQYAWPNIAAMITGHFRKLLAGYSAAA